MFTDITYQDWLATPEDARPMLAVKAIQHYKASADFRNALTANNYFRAEGTEVSNKTILKAKKIEYKDASGRTRTRSGTEDVVGNRICSGMFFKLVVQQNQYLLANGVTMKDEKVKEKLGKAFDKTLESMGEKALKHGVCWGFWNVDHLEIIEAARDGFSGFVALLDEMTSTPMVGIQFWQIAAERPMYVRVFEPDGVAMYRIAKDKLAEVQPKRPYKINTVTDALGSIVTGEENWGRLPIVPLWASEEKRSELTNAIKSKIDVFDRILSDFADNLDRANDVYWVLNNFGGTIDEIAELLEQINRVKAVANMSDGTGTQSTAEPHTIEVPYAARREALQLLRKEIYQDYMALDMDELTGGSLTNVAIEAAMLNLNLKADRYEWQCFQFVQELLSLQGIDTEDIKFKRQTLVNQGEVVADIAAMRQDIDLETALKINPYITSQEEIERIMANKDAEVHSGAPTMDELNRMLSAANQAAQ